MLKIDETALIHDQVPRAVWAVGTEAVNERYKTPHVHRYPTLMLTTRGLVICEVAKGTWMVPPQCALWIPGDLEHSARRLRDAELYVLHVGPTLVPDLPQECCTVSVSPLLRELVIEVSRRPRGDDQGDADRRLIWTMLDQLIAAPVERLHLPVPADPRLRKIADALTANPADRATIAEWARRVGMSERTLFRLVPQETGMSFGRWRQQFHIMLALERLAEGEAVQSIAFDLGYESSSAFITMFRKALGQPPARYFAARRTHEPGTTIRPARPPAARPLNYEPETVQRS